MPKINPNAAELEFKPTFIERYSKLTEFEKFKQYSLSYLDRSIRINTIKISVNRIKGRMKDWHLKQIPWCKEGFYFSHETGRRDIGNTAEHSLGYIYVQEAVSMIPPVVLNPKPTDIVLDCCAAPGSKTTQLSAIMKNRGIIVANDLTGKRLAALGINLQRCGCTNVIVTQMDARSFKQQFNKILVDAPCSGTGTIRKSLKTVSMWNPALIKRLSRNQKSILETVFCKNLKKGGTLVYSTCSLEPEEDEGVISYLLDNHQEARIEKIKLNINHSPAVMGFEGESYNKGVKHCLRIWPQDNNTGGFFVAKIRKI
ncbi:tRNA methyltransferase [Candidatus Woesearchaeota archaeon]|nr:MAG: tRNA methyltransferase [Candidatus Woesearchaeota archaeon]